MAPPQHPRPWNDWMRSRITFVDLVSFESDVGVSGFMTATESVGRISALTKSRSMRAITTFSSGSFGRWLVPGNHQQPDAVACGLGRGVLVGSNLERRVVARRGFAGELDELERLNRLRNAVFADVEVLGRGIGERHTVPAGDRHVDANEVDAVLNVGC